MRVVLLAEVLGIGGLPNYVLMLARLLINSGCDVLVAHGSRVLPAHLEVDGLPLAYLPGLAPSWDPSEAEKAVARLCAWAPNVVHVHLCSNLAIIDGLLQSGMVLVRSFHDFTSLCLRRGRRRWPGDRCQRAVGWACVTWGCVLSPPAAGHFTPSLANLPAKIRERDRYKFFDASVVASTYMAGTLRENGFSPSSIHVVPHFSQFEDAAPGPIVERPGVPGQDRPFELLFSGQAVTGKGLEILIAALAGVRGNWHLKVLSDGPRLKAAKAKAAIAGIGDRIEFLGWAPQAATREHYELADLFVLPSMWDDPAPLVGLEAMAFGTPVVGFAVGGIADYLIDNKTGVLVRNPSAESLRTGLMRAMADAERLHRWGADARAMITRKHTHALHEMGLRRAYQAAAAAAASRRGRTWQAPAVRAQIVEYQAV